MSITCRICNRKTVIGKIYAYKGYDIGEVCYEKMMVRRHKFSETCKKECVECSDRRKLHCYAEVKDTIKHSQQSFLDVIT